MGTHRGRLRIGVIAALAVAIALAVPLSGIAGSRHVLKGATVQTRTIKGLGTVLVNSRGLTLYMFAPDKQKRVTCTAKNGCAVIWPPLKLKAGQKATAGGAAKKKLLSSDKSPAGYRVVTYNRWPLYTYILDKRPGQAKGQNKKLNGGYWWVLSPAGKIIKKKP